MIEKRFDWIGNYRATMIARTEMQTALWFGQDASYQEINKNAGKIVIKEAKFYTSLDERVCQDRVTKDGRVIKGCKSLDGEVIKNYETGEQFIEMVPHPNCRCGSRPILAD